MYQLAANLNKVIVLNMGHVFFCVFAPSASGAARLHMLVITEEETSSFSFWLSFIPCLFSFIFTRIFFGFSFLSLCFGSVGKTRLVTVGSWKGI